MGSKSKKRKTITAPSAVTTDSAEATSLHEATLSIAVPGSIIDSAKTYEAAAAAAGQVARAAALFKVQEIIVYDDTSSGRKLEGTISASAAALARLLQYLETPPYLRSSLTDQSKAVPELQAVEATCPYIYAIHHLRGEDWKSYREGVVMKSDPKMGSFIDIGHERNAHTSEALPERMRVTLYVGDSPAPRFVPAFSETMLEAQVVSPTEPREKMGMYWGYQVRIASSFNKVLKSSPYKGGYDLTIGVSETGVQRGAAELVLPRYQHALIVFGGEKSLEDLTATDASILQSGKTLSDLFGMHINCCPEIAGAGRVKREDEVLISLGYLHPSLAKYGEK